MQIQKITEEHGHQVMQQICQTTIQVSGLRMSYFHCLALIRTLLVGQCVTRLRDGRLVAAVNDVYKNWGPRTPLVLKVSFDDGETWSPWCTLEDQAPPASFQRVIALETGIVNDGKSEFS